MSVVIKEQSMPTAGPPAILGKILFYVSLYYALCGAAFLEYSFGAWRSWFAQL